MSLYGSVVRLDVNVPGEGYKIPPDNPYAQRRAWARPRCGPRASATPGASASIAVTQGAVARGSRRRVERQPGRRRHGQPLGGDRSRGQGRATTAGPSSRARTATTTAPCERGMPPEYEFSHNGGPAAVVGGFVYRGAAHARPGRQVHLRRLRERRDLRLRSGDEDAREPRRRRQGRPRSARTTTARSTPLAKTARSRSSQNAATGAGRVPERCSARPAA